MKSLFLGSVIFRNDMFFVISYLFYFSNTVLNMVLNTVFNMVLNIILNMVFNTVLNMVFNTILSMVLNMVLNVSSSWCSCVFRLNKTLASVSILPFF